MGEATQVFMSTYYTLATSCEGLTHWKRLWCWEGLGAGGEGDDRGWDGWMASLTRWTWVWVNFGSWWWTGRPGVLRFIGLQRVGHDWVTELNWILVKKKTLCLSLLKIYQTPLCPSFLSVTEFSKYVCFEIFSFLWQRRLDGVHLNAEDFNSSRAEIVLFNFVRPSLHLPDTK